MKAFLLAAAPPQLTTAQIQQGAQQFNAQQHPRGADGKFITTGGTVQILGAGGKPVAEGTVVSVTTGSTGTHILVRNPTTGQTLSVTPAQVKQAPIAEATLSAPNTQGIPTKPGAAARAARADAKAGLKRRSGKDALGQQASPALLKAYNAAYLAERTRLAKVAARKALVAQHKATAAAKKKAASLKKAAGSSAYKIVSLKSAQPKHYVGE